MKIEVKKFIKEQGISEAQFFGNEKIGGDLYLSSLTSIPEGFNPTGGGYLNWKNNSKHIGSSVKPVNRNKNFFWDKNGNKFALIDGIFCELLTKKQHTIKGKKYNLWSAKKVNKNEYFFIANKCNYYAHAKDLKKAMEDLLFKIVAEKLKKEPIKKDTLITMNHYRLITGACEFGCKSFMEQNGIKSDKIKACELLPILQKTNALGLLHKQIKKDSTMSRVGIPDYVMVFRKDGERNNPVTNTDLPVDLWQKYASPVWMDIDYGNTLQGFRNGRDEKDEKHICPLQLQTIERLIHLYSNKGDTILTPFMGIGSEVYQAVKMDRKAIGFELKESYFSLAKKNINTAVLKKAQLQLI